MRRVLRWGIGQKLLVLVLVNTLALFLVAGLVWAAFDRVKELSAAIAGQEMAGVFENATLGRDLSATLSEIDRITRSCPSQGDAVGRGEEVVKRLTAFTHVVHDDELLATVEVFSLGTRRLFNQCQSIGQTLAALEKTDAHLLDELNRLENLTSRALIDQTLAGKNTDYLDQVMALVTGYRETVLQIGREVSRNVGSSPLATGDFGKVVSLIDDLRLRLQTMTAATPEMARIARHMREVTGIYRTQVMALNGAMGQFESMLDENQHLRDAVLAHMQRLDVDTASRAGRFTDELRDTIEHTGWQVLWISIAIAALSSLMAIWFVRSGIQRPLVNVLARIHAIRSGSVLPGAPLKPRSDEWGTIDSALSDMSDDLVKTRNLLQQIIDALPIRVFWKDRESRYLGCNPLFARDAGKHAPSELIGRNDYVMTWAEQAELYRADDKLVMETGLPRLNYEEPQTTPSKEEIWLRTSKVPLLDPSGSVFGVLGIYDDITIRKQAELALQRSEQRLRLALDAARQSWFDANLRTGEVRVSEQYPRLLDYEPEAFDTSIQNWMDNIHPEDAGGVRAEFMKLLQTGGPAIMDYRRRNKAGEWIWLQSTAKVVEWDADGHALRLAGIHQDVTARKLSEIELEQHRHHLEELVEKRTLELESAKVAAEVANRAKSTFLANMSHELRTPINGVMGMLGLAKRRMIDPKGMEQLTKAQFAADHLFAVLNDILDLSKIEADRLTVEHVPLQLRGVLDNLVSVIGNSATEKGLLLSVDLPDALASIPLLGDPLRIGQVLVNLTGNAIKFTDHGSINVRVRQQESAQDEVLLRFEVTDTGIGIAPADQGRLFSAFEQADASMTRKYGGTGLGLAISRRLVQLMDGKIGVDSAQGEGSTFWFTVRLQRQDRGAPQPEPVVDEADVERRLINEYKGAMILLAEDEPVNREIACVLLEQVGLAVDQAEDGKEALNLARRKPYALILMDMQMPNMNGIEAARAIRADSLNRNTPILATTANAFAEDRQVCFAAGMNDHLAKPVRPGKLYEMLLKWLDTGKAG